MTAGVGRAETTRRALQVFLTILGSVALVTGTLAVLFGVDQVVDAGRASPNVDSEMRFLGAWYAAAGVVILRTVARVEAEGATIKAVFVVLFIAGCARLLGMVVVGRPHTLFVVLMVIELALPAVIIPWQASVARQTKSSN